MQFARKTGFLFIFIITSIISLGAAGQYQQDGGGNLLRGAHLYESWDLRMGVNLLGNTNPMWKELGRKAELGPVTWRCSSCHGWNYLGSAYNEQDGGFVPGLLIVRNMEEEEIKLWLDGTKNPDHNFSQYLTVAAQKDLVTFLQQGLIDYTTYARQDIFDTPNISSNGENLYKESCRECHGPDGARINFGSAENPAFLGNIAENPWKVVHLIQFGHPQIGGTTARAYGWSLEDIFDVVKYSVILPKGLQVDIAVEDPSIIDYSLQADTAPMVFTAFIIVLVVLLGVGWSVYRNWLKSR